MKKLFVLFLIFTIGVIIYFSLKDATNFLSQKPQEKTYFVKRVIDGDTIELSDGQKVRYIGINTPETVDPRRTGLPAGRQVECFGLEAKEKNKELVEGKTVRLEKDVSETDVYKRLLRYVYVDNVFINDLLVKEGFANVATYPPDVKYASQFLESEKYARENKLGLWKSCPLTKSLESSI